MTTNNWMETNGKSASSGLPNMKFETGVTQVRIVSGVLRRYQYWLTNSEGKKNAFECLRFIRETERFQNSLPDPVAEKGFTEKNEKQETVSLRPKRAYACAVINRKTGKVELMDLKKSVFDEVIAYMKSEGISNPSDIEIFIEKTGIKWNEVKYKVDAIKTLKFNADKKAIAELHEADEALISELKPIDEIIHREDYAEQKQRLDAFLAGEKSTNAEGGQPNGSADHEAISDLDD